MRQKMIAFMPSVHWSQPLQQSLVVIQAKLQHVGRKLSSSQKRETFANLALMT